jgi:hypothetical protein
MSGPAHTRPIGACWFNSQLNDPDLPSAGTLASAGITTSYFGAFRPILEPTPGNYVWTTLDAVLNAAIARGITPVVKITEGGPGVDATPPEPVAYAAYLTALITHVGDKCHQWAIENEMDRWVLDGLWTAAQYADTRAAAYAAIKAAHTNADVLDSGLTMNAFIAYRLQELVDADDMDGALATCVRWNTYMRKADEPLPTTSGQLITWLAHAKRVRGKAFVQELIDHPTTYNVLQFHFMQHCWELAAELCAWLRGWTGSRPQEVWETQFGWEGEEQDPPLAFTEDLHAQGVIKNQTALLAAGVRSAIYEPYIENEATLYLGLWDGAQLRQAALALGWLNSQINGYSRIDVDQYDVGGTTVWQYGFHTSAVEVIVVWASESITLTINRPGSPVYDLYGTPITDDPTHLDAGVTPLYVITEN